MTGQPILTPRQEAARRLIILREASQSFLGFIKLAYPQFKLAPFHLKLIDTLDKLEKRTLGTNKLLITMPPRHGKSTIATVAFPAYFMMRRSNRRILSVSYGEDLAKTFGRSVRDLTMEPQLAQAFPNFELNKTSTAADEWQTTDDGRYFACGVGGGTTGRPANLLIVDDPIKSRPEAESPSRRNTIWNYYTGSLANRLEPELDGTPPIELLIQTRWHPEDLAGRIMNLDEWGEDWTHIDFPAISTVVNEDGTTSEQPLWPERFGLDFLHKMQKRDPRDFAALYQQQPFIQGGNLIKPAWFNYMREQDIPPTPTIIMTADTAFKQQTINDPTVIMTLGMTAQGDIYILNIIRERLDYPALRRRLITENTIWRGRGLRGIYIEDKASGQSIIQDLRTMPGVSVIPYKFNGARDASDKVARVNSILPLIEGGRVFIQEDAPFLDDFIAEVEAFPNAKHDDQVDALAIGLDILSRMTVQSDFGSIGMNLPPLSPHIISRIHSPDKDLGRPFNIKEWSKPIGEL